MNKQKKIPEIIVDIQEKSGILKEMEKMPEFFPEIRVEEIGFYDPDTDEYIQCGDFTNEYNSFVSEHKIIHTWETDDYTGQYKEGDFHPSLISGRIQDQCAKMKIYYKKNQTVLAEGFLINYAVAHPILRPKAYAVVGHLANMGIPFIECYHTEELLEKLYWINRKSGSEDMMRVEIKNQGRFVISQVVALKAIKNFGVDRINSALRAHGNIWSIILNWNNLHTLKGIGPKSEAAFRDWLFDEVIIED